MKWLKNKLRKWVNTDKSSASPNSWEDKPVRASKFNESVGSNNLSGEPLRLAIYAADGGYVLQTNKYDSKNDRMSTHLHIVTHEQDLGSSVGKIITMDLMR